MNQVQVVALLNTLEGIKVDYLPSDVTKDLPKIVISVQQGSNFGADNQVYVQGWDFTVDLYTPEKDTATEKKVKDLLNDNGIYWTRTESYYNDELVYEVEFTFSVLGDETNPIPDGGDQDGTDQ